MQPPPQSKARLVLTALLLEGRPVAEIATAYGVHRSWIYKLKTRFDIEGEAAFQPRSRRPHTSPTATPAATVDLILQLRGWRSQATETTTAPTPSPGTWNTTPA